MHLREYLKINRGEAVRIAALFGVHPSAVWQWCQNRVPGDRVWALCEATDWAVMPHELRPDIYPPELLAYSHKIFLNHEDEQEKSPQPQIRKKRRKHD